jgi:hypothetical protein
MAFIKPGTEIKGYIWTGERWAKKPERTSDKAKLQREIEAGRRNLQSWQEKRQKATYPGGAPQMSQSTKKSTSRGTPMRPTSGSKPKPDTKKPTVKPTTTSSSTPKPAVTKPTTASTSKKTSTTPTAKPKPTGLTVGGGRTKTPASKRPAVSQSNTEWVKKGDVVGGKVVQKGYLAQKGKPEKKVTARVKLVTDTSKGKAGQKVSYTKGRASKGKSK